MVVDEQVPSLRLGSSVEILGNSAPNILNDNRIYQQDVWNPDDNNFLDNEFPNYYIMDPKNRAGEYSKANQSRPRGYVNGMPCIVPLVTLADGVKKVHYVKEFTYYHPDGPLYFKVTDD